MPVFEYKGVDAGKKNRTGLIEADSAKGARSKLRRQGIFTTDIRMSRASAVKRRGSDRPRRRAEAREKGKGKEEGEKRGGLSLDMEIDLAKYFTTVSVEDVAMATRQLATLLGAGIPMIEALTALVDQVENDKLRLIYSQVKERVNEGTSLAKALSEHPKVFGELYVNMVRAGEASGALEAVMNRLADYTEGQVAMRGKVMGAVMYPAIMSFIGVGLVTFLMLVVIPKIEKLFNDMGARLPFVTRAVIATSGLISGYWWVALLLIAVGVWRYRVYTATEEGRRWRDETALKLPLFGRVFRLVSIARFASTLSTLLAAGVPLLTSLNIARNVISNVIIAKAVDDARDSVREGQSLAAPLKASGEFPPMVTHMLAIGEKTGEVEPMLARVSDTYEAQVSRTLGSLTTILEPLMIVFMGGAVGFIAMAVLLPMLRMNQLAR